MIPSSPRQVYHALRPLIDELYTKSAGLIARGGNPVFVFDPTAVPIDNVYNSWPNLMAAVGKTFGIVFVEFRGTPTIPAGVWNFPDGVVFLAHDFAVFVTCANGVKIVSENITFEGLGMVSVSTAPIVDLNATSAVVIADNSVVGSGAGSAAFFDLTAGVPLGGTFIVRDLSELGGLGGPGITVGAGQQQNILLVGGSLIPAGTATGLGTVSVQIDQSSQVTGAQTVTTFTVTDADNSAAQNNLGGLGPAGTIQLTSANFTRKRTGLVTVSGSITSTGATGGAGTTITYHLIRDVGGGSITVATAGPIDVGAAGRNQQTLVWIDTLLDYNPHTYTIQAVASAGTLTGPVGTAQITINER